jgi:hypothetical protein
MPQFQKWLVNIENKGRNWLSHHFEGGKKLRQKRHIGAAGAPFGTKILNTGATSPNRNTAFAAS